MNILLLNSVYNFGSTGRIVRDLKYVIESRDSKCSIIYGRGNTDSNDNNVWKIGSELDFKTHALLARITDKSGFFSSFYTDLIIKKIQEINPDLIHLHNIHGYYLNIKILFNFLKLYNKPIVWTLHDCWSFTGHCAYYDAINCQKWQIECSQCPQIHTYPKSFYDNSNNNFYLKKELFTNIKNLHLVTPSQWLHDEIQKSFLNTYPCHVIANGIDLNQFKIDISSIKSKVISKSKKLKILGVASIWEKRKGFDDFIKLSQILDTEKYEITMVGVNYKQKIKLEKFGIIAIERTNNIQELINLYKQADVFFNPTYEDNFPTTNLEALACGTPVLTYKTGGSPESLTNKCGIVIEKGDLNSAIFHLNQWETYNFREKDCIEQAKNFDKFLKFNEYYQLYNEILCNLHK